MNRISSIRKVFAITKIQGRFRISYNYRNKEKAYRDFLGNYFTLTAREKWYYFLIIYVFWPVESESDIDFRWQEPGNLHNPETDFRIIGDSRIRQTEMETRFRFYKSNYKVFRRSVLLSLS